MNGNQLTTPCDTNYQVRVRRKESLARFILDDSYIANDSTLAVTDE